jgi:alpha-L-fucosidase
LNSLREIGKWLEVNGEAVYGTKRWKISREGPTTLNFKSTEDRAEKGFQNVFTSEDFWFTQKGNAVYCICLADKAQNIVVKAFTKDEYKIKNVTLLGSKNKILWKHTMNGLEIDLSELLPSDVGFALKVELKK